MADQLMPKTKPKSIRPPRLKIISETTNMNWAATPLARMELISKKSC
jgi:hypothetical protein